MNNSNTISIGERTFKIKTPTLKVLNEFKTAAGFDIASNPEALQTALGDFKKIAIICSVICEDINQYEGNKKLSGEQISEYIYENATVNDFKEIMGFFSESLRQNSTGTRVASTDATLKQVAPEENQNLPDTHSPKKLAKKIQS